MYSPAVAGIFLVWRQYGLKGLGGFFRRVTWVRMPAAWWIFLVIGVPAVFYAGAEIKGTITEPFPFDPWYELFPALAVGMVIGPVEEFGWRGVALPLLQRRFAPYFIGVVAISVMLACMFNASGGSILIAALYHPQMNGPVWPDAQPWDSYLFAATTVVVVVINRKAMFRRAGAATAVVPAARRLMRRRPDEVNLNRDEHGGRKAQGI